MPEKPARPIGRDETVPGKPHQPLLSPSLPIQVKCRRKGKIMKTRMLTSIRTEIIHLNGAGERVPLCNLISELTFEQEIDMDSTENRNRLWDCIDRLAPEDRDLINRVYFCDECRRGDDELAQLLGLDDPAVLSQKRRAILNALQQAMTL